MPEVGGRRAAIELEWRDVGMTSPTVSLGKEGPLPRLMMTSLLTLRASFVSYQISLPE